tara:strand:- start:256 stop:435 length:180 start_codon:yes stop_codon:yes gene_type:complete
VLGAGFAGARHFFDFSPELVVNLSFDVLIWVVGLFHMLLRYFDCFECGRIAKWFGVDQN